MRSGNDSTFVIENDDTNRGPTEEDEEDEDEMPPELVPLEDPSCQQPVMAIDKHKTSGKIVPVTIISGFLGAGKSTLLNYILNQPHGRRIAVIENEFGKGLGIESAIAKDGTDGSSLEGFFELANGCICCSVKSDLLATLEMLIERKSKFDYVIIETSGMADPGPVASCLWVDEELESQLRLDGIVTVVDAKHIDRHLISPHDEEEEQEQQEQEQQHKKDGRAEDDEVDCHPAEAFRQVCVADRLLVNKTDLVSETELSELEGKLQGLNGMALIRRTEYSRVDLDFVLGIDCYSNVGGGREPLFIPLPRNGGEEDSPHHHEGKGREEEKQQHRHKHKSGVSTVAVIEPIEVDLEAVKRWLADLLWQDGDDDNGEKGKRKKGPEIYRMKGTLAVAGSDVIHILQAVHETFEIEPSRSLSWSSGTEGGRRECRLVVIGKRLDEEAVRASLRATAAVVA